MPHHAHQRRQDDAVNTRSTAGTTRNGEGPPTVDPSDVTPRRPGTEIGASVLYFLADGSTVIPRICVVHSVTHRIDEIFEHDCSPRDAAKLHEYVIGKRSIHS
jgi:hypothetical protein